MTIKYIREVANRIEYVTEENTSNDAGRAAQIELISGVDADSIVIE